MKKNLKGKCFDDVEAVKTASQRGLDDIKVEELQRCFKQEEKELISALPLIKNTLKM